MPLYARAMLTIVGYLALVVMVDGHETLVLRSWLRELYRQSRDSLHRVNVERRLLLLSLLRKHHPSFRRLLCQDDRHFE